MAASLAILAGSAGGAVAKNANSGPAVPMLFDSASVKVKSLRIVLPSATANQTGGNAVWYIVDFVYTNNTGHDFIPNMQRFAFQANGGLVVYSQVSGSPDLIGIENLHANDRVKAGESAEFQAGFLVTQGQSGYLFYDQTT